MRDPVLEIEIKWRKLHFYIGSNLISGEVYENFFVCNYGVGGNVLGQPVFDCPSEKEDGEQPQTSTGWNGDFKNLLIFGI